MAPRPAPLVAIALALSGCGLSDPYEHQQAQSTSSTARSSTSTSTGRTVVPPTSSTTTTAGNPGERDEGPTSPAPPRWRGRVHRSGRARAFRQPVHQLDRRRTTRSLAPARRARDRTGQSQALALATRATVLARYQVSNSGSVTAIAPGQGPQLGRWAVVTNELTTGTGPYLGLPATSHVTWATLIHTRHGYVIDGWYPAS